MPSMLVVVYLQTGGDVRLQLLTHGRQHCLVDLVDGPVQLIDGIITLVLTCGGGGAR